MRYSSDCVTGEIVCDDGVRFAADERDPRYADYLAWLQAGGTPGVVVSPPPAPPLSAAAFRARFTDAEMGAILMLAYAGAGDVHAAMLLLKLQTSSEIDAASAEAQAGLAYLTARGVLAAGRAAEIAAG